MTYRLEEIGKAAEAFIQSIGDDRVFLFEGDMGAGKTTFISEVCRQMGCEDDFGSPTFSLVNEYADRKGNPIYHFDFYRIDSPAEALDMGAAEYFDSDELCFVEWPDKAGAIIPDDARKVLIKVNADGTRTLNF